MQIALVGAFDRYNYGDVLMPIILRTWFENHYHQIKFEYFGLKRADLSKIGGVKCHSLSDLYVSKNEYDAFIVVGGEVLAAHYYSMLPMSLVNLHYPLPEIILKFLSTSFKLNPRATNKICARVLNVSSKMPWILENMPGPVIYNTVGGSRNLIPFIMENPYYSSVLDLLSDSDYISVRSDLDVQSLIKANIKCHKYPDSVSLISECWNPQFVLNCASNIVKKQILNKKYFVFQINMHDFKKYNREKIIQNLQLACSENHISCILVPIGFAPAHDDYEALKFIDENTDEHIEMLKNNNIFDITAALMCAKCYLGTSLHGCIVSSSYGIPHSTLSRKETKTSDYLSSWHTTPIPMFEIENLSNTLMNLISLCDYDFSAIGKKNIMYVRDNYTKIANILGIN